MSKRRHHSQGNRLLRMEPLERRQLLAADMGTLAHNAEHPADVNGDFRVTSLDALIVVNQIQRSHRSEGESSLAGRNVSAMVDVDANGRLTASDALIVINSLAREGEQILQSSMGDDPLAPADFTGIAKAAGVDADGTQSSANDEFFASFNDAAMRGAQNLLEMDDVETLLRRASMATPSQDAIIAVVDRTGRILGVRVEKDVDTGLKNDPQQLAFAIDGAVAKARTAAFFSSNAAPLTSRTVRFISQSTITQREVESSPTASDPAYQGPGFVAPIGVGGHFPPEVAFTPQVDLFAIEHQSRDSQIHAGANGIKESTNVNGSIVVGGDDFVLRSRFNADPQYVPREADEFFQTWPESYGVATGLSPESQSRGVGTLPGGVPLYKLVTDPTDPTFNPPLSKSINLVGGIGVFFPGEDGYATHEQGFAHGVGQTEKVRTNASKVLESEYAAFIAASGAGIVAGNPNFNRDVSDLNDALPPLPDFVLPNGRIDLVGITLEIFGPHPDRSFRQPGIDRLIQLGRSLGPGIDSGMNKVVDRAGNELLAGQAVPEGWLIAPHDGANSPGTNTPGLTAADVQQIIEAGIEEANRTRAAIRLDIDNGFRPGVETRMVLAVADTNGELLGLFRMPDATIFSIDVSIAKARNTAYYADADVLQDVDRIDFNGDGVFGPISQSLSDLSGDTVPPGTALTNRTFRFIVEPRFPTGSELEPSIANDLVNDANQDLCDQTSLCTQVAPHSVLRLPGINPRTAENIVDNQPLDVNVYRDDTVTSFLAFDAFNPARNFRDPGDDGVLIAGTNIEQKLANQNGIVFFPGSSPVYVGVNRSSLAGGFGVSGDGVDQDDVVTSAGQQGFEPPPAIRVDEYVVGGVRLPFQKFNRNPFGD